MVVVQVTGWQPGFKKVQFSKLVRCQAGVKLQKAVEITGAVMNGETVKLAFQDPEEAARFCKQAKELGAIAMLMLET